MPIDFDCKRALTFEQWSTINRALCGARLELNGITRGTVKERLAALSDAIKAINDYTEVK